MTIICKELKLYCIKLDEQFHQSKRYSIICTLILLFIQLNYQFMKKCVEGAPITPMQKEWAQKIVHMIPERLRATPVLKECIRELFDEVKKDYTTSMKKSMGMCSYR